jgi:hypothetical protein
MDEDFIDYQVGDLLIATGPVWAVTSEAVKSTDTLFEGNSTTYPKGTIMLVVSLLLEDAHDDTGYLVARAIVEEKLMTILLCNTEIIRKSTNIK